MWVSKEFYFFVRWGCFNFFWVGLCVAKVWFSVKEQRKCQPNKSRPKDLFEFVCLVVFESVFCCRVGSLRLLPTRLYTLLYCVLFPILGGVGVIKLRFISISKYKTNFTNHDFFCKIFKHLYSDYFHYNTNICCLQSLRSESTYRGV